MIPAPRWERVKELFAEAVGLEGAPRAAFLAEACGADETLRSEVESLLASHEEARGFFTEVETPPQAGPHDAERQEAESLIGRRLGPYRLLDLVGHGGMGDVYRAVRDDDHFKKLVALKLVRPGLDSDFMLRRFRAERQILARLEHPNIARLLDGGASEDGRPFFVMEHVEGTRIDAFAEARGLDLRARLELFRTVCAAVQYAHQNLVVHRDLKPSNILVTPEGVPKLLDFGIAKLLDADSPGEATATSFAPMTPAYASPEQARGEPITTATDVYSLGVVLYQVLTGRLPYRLRSRVPVEILRAVVEQEPERPSAALTRPEDGVGPEAAEDAVPAKATAGAPDQTRPALARRLRGDVDNIIMMALRKEPQRRYPSAAAFSEDIRSFLEGRPVTARKGTLGYRAGKFVRRNKVAIASATALFALTIGYGISMAGQARRVARERDKAEKVSAFLVDLFKVSDPFGEGKGGSATAREMLDQGATKIETELKAQPEVRAALMDTMGLVYSHLGMYDKATTLLHEALTTRRRLLGSEHVDVAATLTNLGNVLADKGDSAAAEALHREALAMRRRLLGSEHPNVATSLSNLATVLRDRGDHAGAETLHREALAMRRKLLGNDHPDVARSLNNLANVLTDRGKSTEAEALHREALASKRRLLGSDHPDVAVSLNNLAAVYYDRADWAAAEALYREALVLYRRRLGNEHPDVAMSLDNLGIVRMKQGDLAGAAVLYREALALYRKLVGSEHIEVAAILYRLGSVLRRKGDYAEAETVHREALAVRRKLLGSEHRDVAVSLNGLANVMVEKGDYAGAETLYREALAMRRKLLGNDHGDVAGTLNSLADALRGQGKLAEAETLYRQALELKREALGDGHPDTAESLLDLGALLTERGEPIAGEPLLRQALDIRRKALPAGQAEVAEAQSALGGCLLALRRHGEAEPLLIESYDVLATERGKTSRPARQALERIVRLYTAWGKAAKAVEYRALLASPVTPR